MSLMPYIAVAVIAIFVYMIFKSNTSTTTGTSNQRYRTIDDEFNAKKKEKQARIDRILEKINDKGVKSLTSQEKNLLDEYSNSK